MILVDASAWIDFFRGRKPFCDIVENLLDSNEVAICGPVETEIRRGLISEKDKTFILSLMEGCNTLEQPSDLWREAGELGRLLGKKGTTVKSFDLLISVYVLSHEVKLLTKDKDFDLIQKAGIPLLLFESR